MAVANGWLILRYWGCQCSAGTQRLLMAMGEGGLPHDRCQQAKRPPSTACRKTVPIPGKRRRCDRFQSLWPTARPPRAAAGRCGRPAKTAWRIACLRLFSIPVGSHPSGRIGEGTRRAIPQNNLFPFLTQVAVGRRAPSRGLRPMTGPPPIGTGCATYIHVDGSAEGPPRRPRPSLLGRRRAPAPHPQPRPAARAIRVAGAGAPPLRRACGSPDRPRNWLAAGGRAMFWRITVAGSPALGPAERLGFGRTQPRGDSDDIFCAMGWACQRGRANPRPAILRVHHPRPPPTHPLGLAGAGEWCLRGAKKP